MVRKSSIFMQSLVEIRRYARRREKEKLGVFVFVLFNRHVLDLFESIFGPFNVFILLNGWICSHGVLD